MTLSIYPPSAHQTVQVRRLNEALLDDPTTLEVVSRSLQFYFETNSSEDVSTQATWKGHNATIRQELIAHISRIKKEKQKEFIGLLEQIHSLELKHETLSDPADAQKLDSLCFSLSQCLDRRARDKGPVL